MNLSLSSTFRIIGIVLAVVSLSMLPSLIVSFIYDDPSTYIPFMLTMVIACVIGLLLMGLCHSRPLNLKVRDGFLIVTLCWFISAVLGAMPFVVTDSIPHFADAFFESCSGFSTTGATVLAEPELLPKGILFWRSFTHWIGGMGILIFAIALMPSLGISGQNIAVSEAPGPSLDKITPKMTDTAKSLYTIYLLFTIIETIMLMAGGMSLYDALITTFGSVGTGGLSNYSDSVGHFDSTYLRMVVTAFMFLCGVNFNLYYLSMKRGIKVLFRDSEFRIYFGIFAVSSLFIFISLMISGLCDSVEQAFSDAVFQVSSIMTTTGFITADYELWPIACQIVLLFLMFVGGMFFIYGRRSQGHQDNRADETDKARHIHKATPQRRGVGKTQRGNDTVGHGIRHSQPYVPLHNNDIRRSLYRFIRKRRYDHVLYVGHNVYRQRRPRIRYSGSHREFRSAVRSFAVHAFRIHAGRQAGALYPLHRADAAFLEP